MTAGNELEQFFISIGVNSDDLKEGDKAVTAAVLSMKKSLEGLVDSFDETTNKAEKSQKKIGDSTDKLSKDLKSSTHKMNATFDSVKNSILSLAGVSLTLGGAFSWIKSTTSGLIELGVQSKILGMSAKEIDGWGRAYKAAGSTAENAIQNLRKIQQMKADYAMGNADGTYVAVSRLAAMAGTTIDVKQNAGDIQMQIANALKKVSANNALYFGNMLGYDDAAIAGMRSGQIQRDQPKYAASSGVNEKQIEEAKRLNEKFEELTQKMKTLGLELAETVMPSLEEFINWLTSNWPEIDHDFKELLKGMKEGATEANHFAEEVGGWKNVIVGLIALRFGSWLLGIGAAAQTAMGGGGLAAGAGKALGVAALGFGAFKSAEALWEVITKLDKKDPVNSQRKILVDVFGNDMGSYFADWAEKHEQVGQYSTDRKIPYAGGKQPYGERNNNPGNMEFKNQKNAKLDPSSSHNFAIFKTPQDGIDAMRRQLGIYDKRGTNSIQAIIKTWAPEFENNTKAYIATVARKLGVNADQKLNMNDPTVLKELMKAIVTVEQGRNSYPESMYQHAVQANLKTVAPSSTHKTSTHIGQVVVHSSATNAKHLLNDLHRKTAVQSSVFSSGQQ
ncbi:hypothetical protein [Acinetobacter nectaris]|uniref:hypothetical protein n=1 Tax=Acinetobacter nectaris TaxID=1219382 RepID=UPI001F408C53|nr:hypothetical protein [Acinetobacter nectaris]MCF9034192.1 hypothetical protein [Acinetobacter nectaris]